MAQADAARAASSRNPRRAACRSGRSTSASPLSDEDLAKAKDYLAERVKAFDGFADEIRRLSSSAETRGTIEKLKGTIASYQAAAGKMATIKTELLEIAAVEASGLTVTDEVQAKAGQADQRGAADRFYHDGAAGGGIRDRAPTPSSSGEEGDAAARSRRRRSRRRPPSRPRS